MGNIILVENSAASTKMELYEEDVNKAGEKETGPCRHSRLLDVVPVTPSNPHMLVFLPAFSIPSAVCGVSTLQDYGERLEPQTVH